MNSGSRSNTNTAPLATADASALVAPFGEAQDGHRAALYTLRNRNIRVRITDYGGRIVSVEAPDGPGGTIMFCSASTALRTTSVQGARSARCLAATRTVLRAVALH